MLAVQMIYMMSNCVGKNNDAAETNLNPAEQPEGEDQMSKSDSILQLSNINWPPEQALPGFPVPAEKLYSMDTAFLTPDERITISALQGIANKTEPRLLLTEDGDIPRDTWAKTFNLHTVTVKEQYDLIAKFKDEVRGIVVYDPSKSSHYRNIASSVANINGYLPVTNGIKKTLARYGVEFDEADIIDITGWTLTSPIDIYGKFYDEYWRECTKRLLISANPDRDFDHCRDIAAAVGAAVVYLDCKKSDERALYEKFMYDMAGNRDKNNTTAIVMGWFTSERSGITAGSAYGVSSIPADLYISGSVYGGVTYNKNPEDRTINIPAVPPKNGPENKVYVAVFMTDGDNIQYIQRFMRKLWDSPEETASRGKVAVNWTISPSLVDIGPGILNYYYSLATEKECFVAGPSGMGYLMPVNTNREDGVRLGEFLTDKTYMDAYTKLTERYLQKAGLRVVTIWDDANGDLRDSYERNCRYLYGATVQNFGAGNVSSGITNGRLAFIKHETHYEGQYHTILADMTKKISAWDGEKPLFLTYQVKVWECGTPQIVKLFDELDKKFEGKVEFVRADHFFALYNEANGLPFN